MTAPSSEIADLKRTPLHDWHVAEGARMVPFAGYAMPVTYPAGTLKEHEQCRMRAALFDVSHMGQVRLVGDGVVGALEALVPADLAALAPGRMRYTLFTTDTGGILDDLIVTRERDGLLVVINAARRAEDMIHLRAHLPRSVDIVPLDDLALLALQGPAAVAVLSRLAPAAADLGFMQSAELAVGDRRCRVSRSGYTGEDGFEIAVPGDAAQALAERLCAEAEVAPSGLGARDTLRLEAGLCLYGHDIDETTSPIEAGLGWTIGKRRRAEGGFPGAAVILRHLAEGPPRRRVGVRPGGRAIAREGAAITDAGGAVLGRVTSGGFAPTVGAPIAMGIVAAEAAAIDTELCVDVRGRAVEAVVARMPFVPHRYHKS